MNSREYDNFIRNMNDEQLEERYVLNKKRMVGNILIGFASIAGVTIMTEPALAILGVTALRMFYINSKNKVIEEEADKRGISIRR